MNAAPAIRDWHNDLVDGWNRFWFTPAAPQTLALIRIFAGAMLFYTHLVWSLDLEAFFGAHSWLTTDVLNILRFDNMLRLDSYAWSHFTLLARFDSVALLWAAHIGALAVFAMFTVGLFTRITAVLSCLLAISYVHRALGTTFGLDQINTLLVMYLMLAPCGACYSVDRWLKQRKANDKLPDPPATISTNVAGRLIQLHLCIIYMFSGMGKLLGDSWWNGTAIWQAFAKLEYQSVDMTWMADWPLTIAALTHLTIFWEVFYCALVWPRLSRPIIIGLSVPMHLGIAVCMGMITFGLIMIVANMAFVSPQLSQAVVDRIFRRFFGTGKFPRSAAL